MMHLWLALDRTDNRLRRPELIDLWHSEVGNSVETQIEGLDVGNIPIRRLGDQMGSKWTRQTGNPYFKLVLEDLVGRPSVLSRFRVMDVLPVAEDLTLSTVERPNEDDLVLASTTAGSQSSARNGRGISDSKFESDPFLGKSKRLRRIFDAIVNLIWAENVGHVCIGFRERRGFRKIECVWRRFLISRLPLSYRTRSECSRLRRYFEINSVC
mmetsp:Transcript_24019/g.56697  ORF Transcript_24019/g.56697 Transcript_24019/m.56697 type:complete len:212 (-) Transcript_24019:165-800(-)